jgi:hypothetical protein
MALPGSTGSPRLNMPRQPTDTEADRKATCAGKEKHDRATANKIARKMKSTKLTTYRCRFCDHWHIAHAKDK